MGVEVDVCLSNHSKKVELLYRITEYAFEIFFMEAEKESSNVNRFERVNVTEYSA